MRLSLPVLGFLVGCGTVPATLERSALEPHSNGATLYVIETWSDFLDEVDTNRCPADPAAQWLGEQLLRIVLREVSKGTKARLISARHVDLNQWEDVTLPPDRPVQFLEREADGRYALHEFGSRSGFGLKMRATKIQEGRFVDLECALTLFWADHSRLPGTTVEAGKPSLRKLPVFSGTPTIPIGGTLWIPCPRDGDRAYLVLLHIASVTPA